MSIQFDHSSIFIDVENYIEIYIKIKISNVMKSASPTAVLTFTVTNLPFIRHTSVTLMPP